MAHVIKASIDAPSNNIEVFVSLIEWEIILLAIRFLFSFIAGSGGSQLVVMFHTYELSWATNKERRRHEHLNNLDISIKISFYVAVKIWSYDALSDVAFSKYFSNFDRIILCTDIVTNFHYYVIENAKYWHWNYFSKKVFKKVIT